MLFKSFSRSLGTILRLTAISAAIAASACPGRAILVNNTAGFVNPVVTTNFDPIPIDTFSPGPLLFTASNGETIRFTSTNSNNQGGSVINYTSTYGFNANGIWINLPMAGLNTSSGYMDFTFIDGPVPAVGGFLNWAPNTHIPNEMYIAALDAVGNVLESYSLNFNTGGGNNTGFDYFIQRSTADIATLRLGDSYVGIANFTFDDASRMAAVPGPLPLLGVGAAFGYSRKLRKRIANGKVMPVASGIV
jgi:hypothetical protein